MRGQIESWLNKPINDGGFEDLDDQGEHRYRDETCLVELWVECLMGDRKAYDQTKAQMLGRVMSRMPEWVSEGRLYTHARYGRQRVYRRGGPIGELKRHISI